MFKFISANTKSVLINATNIGLKMNGIGNYTLNLVKQFALSDSRINFLIYFNESCKSHVNGISFPENFEIRWVSKWMSPDKKFPGHLLRLLYSNCLAIKHFRHLHFSTSPLEICFFKRNQIVTVHDVIPILFKKFHKKQYHFYKVILKYVLQFVKMVITPSNYTKKMVHEYYELEDNKVQSIPLAVDSELLQLNDWKEDKKPYILYVGRINEMKNVIQVIRSFSVINKSMDLSLIVVGDDKTKFDKLISESKCEIVTKSKIKFIQNATNEEKYRLMRNASIFLYPTLFEGFGFTPLEAMSCGCPVIVSNNSSLPEVCGDAACYVQPENEYDIAEAVMNVLINSEKRANLIQKGFERVQLYSWSRTASEHLIMLNHILYGTESVSVVKSKVRTSFILSGEKF